MSDRATTLTVVLDGEYRVDDIQELMNAISMFSPVISVDANVSDVVEHMAKVRAKFALEQKILNAIRED